jgi:uncharacterized membrane protein YhhN
LWILIIPQGDIMKKLLSVKHFKTLFIFFITVFILREIFTFQGIIGLKYIFTPLITSSIIGFAVLSIVHSKAKHYNIFILIGLISALIADTLLMIVEVNLLKYGIIFFLLTHIFYVIAFAKDFRFKKWNAIPLIFFSGIIITAFSLIQGKTGGLDIPVLLYMIILFSMAFFAIAETNNGFSRETVFMLCGAILFVISDLILAVNAFLYKIPHSSVLTWATYAPAQLLITLSCFKEDKNI